MKRRDVLTMLGAGSALITVAATRSEDPVEGEHVPTRARDEEPEGVAIAVGGEDRNAETLATWQSRPRIPMLRASDSDDPRLRHVLQAVEKGERLRFEYWGGTTPRADREVTPGLVFRLEENEEAPIYINGYCHRRQAERVFRWDRLVLRSI